MTQKKKTTNDSKLSLFGGWLTIRYSSDDVTIVRALYRWLKKRKS